MTTEEAIERLRKIKTLDVFGEDYMPALDLAISALERDRWISVKDATPKMVGEEGYTGYLVYSDGFMQVADYVSDGYGVGEFHIDGEYDPDVVAFMPLPEPPKEET